MLEFLRKQAQSPVLQAIIVIIVLVFIFWGTNMGGGNRRDAVATVNGEPISISTYSREYSRMVDNLREQFGGSLPKNLIESLGIKEQVLQRLIQQTLMIQGAEKMGLYVSNWEIQEEILKQPFFLVNGVFDETRYKQVLAQNKLSPKQYEASLRQELLGRKVGKHLSALTVVSDWEIDQRFAFNNNEIKLAYAKLSAADFAPAVKIDADALADYFANNKEAYKTAPQVKLKYLAFPVAQAMEALTISDEDISAYYQQKISDYEEPEQRAARHILLKTDGSNDADQKAKSEDILAQLKAGADFAELAKKHSDDPGSASRGGELGTFSRGRMVPAFDEAVFSLEKGAISELVKTRFGYHIIEVTDIKAARTRPLEEVKDAISRSLKQSRAKDKAFEEADTAYGKIFQAGSLAKYSEEEGISLLTTDFFSQNNPPAELAGKPGLTGQAFTLAKGELSSLIEEPSGYYIIYIEDVIEPSIPELATVKSAVEADFKADKSLEMAEIKAKAALAACTDGTTFKEAVTSTGASVHETPWFSRSKRGASTLPDAVNSQAFDLSDSNPYPEEIVNEGTDFYLFRLQDKRQNTSASAADKERFAQTLRQEKQRTIVESWLEHMMATGEITTNTKILNQE